MSAILKRKISFVAATAVLFGAGCSSPRPPQTTAPVETRSADPYLGASRIKTQAQLQEALLRRWPLDDIVTATKTAWIIPNSHQTAVIKGFHWESRLYEGASGPYKIFWYAGAGLDDIPLFSLFAARDGKRWIIESGHFEILEKPRPESVRP